MVVMITDGQPTDVERRMEAVAAVVKHAGAKSRAEKIGFFAFSAGNVNVELLKQLTKREVCAVNKAQLGRVFHWLMESIELGAHSRKYEAIELPDPESFGFERL